MEATALYGNTHFNLGKKIIEKSDLSLSESEKKAFLSGIVYADIGRFKFDKETGIDSDSDKFAEEMEKLAKTPEEKWFAYGFKVHVFQDKETKRFLTDVLCHEYSSSSEYMNDCGTLDAYFSEKSGIICNDFLDKFNFRQIINGLNIENLDKLSSAPESVIKDFTTIFTMVITERISNSTNKNNLVIYDELIKSTYESLGFEINLDDIHEQAGNLLGTFIIISSIIDDGTEELSSTIEEKSDNLAELCISNFKFLKEKAE